MNESYRSLLSIVARFGHGVIRGRRHMAAVGFCLTLLLSGFATASAVAQVDEAQDDVVQADVVEDIDDLTVADDPAEQQRLEELLRAASILRSQLDDLSSRLGAYDASLLEVQADLGQAYLRAGQVDEAIGAGPGPATGPHQ